MTEPVEVYENSCRYFADLLDGHKTGFYFDHRANRRDVAKLARGKRVLGEMDSLVSPTFLGRRKKG